MPVLIFPELQPPPQGRWECRPKGEAQAWSACAPEDLYRRDKEYRHIPPATSEVRAWAHKMVDYIADACEAGNKCVFDETHAFLVFQRDGELVVGFALPEKKK